MHRLEEQMVKSAQELQIGGGTTVNGISLLPPCIPLGKYLLKE